jgi:Ca-activated chloride channel family protein
MSEQLSFEMHADLDLVADEVPTQRVLELVVIPPSARASGGRPPLNLALVIDRSGSMSGDKIDNVRKAAAHVLDLLQEQDRVAIVAYDNTINVLSPSQHVTPQVRASLMSRILELTPGNTTNLCGGWLSGCEEIAQAAYGARGQLNRALLLTDGLANVGITDLEVIGLHASQLLNKGIATSTFGVGLDFNEHLLEHMANQGGGRFYFIADSHAIPSIFVQEFQDLAAVTAQAVEVMLEIPTQVDAKVLGSWRSEQNGPDLHLWLGDIPASQRREVYIRLLVPPQSGQIGQIGQSSQAELAIQAHLSGRSEQGELLAASAQVTFQYAPRLQVAAAPVRQEVMQRFSQVEMADSATEALKLERAGQRQQASRLIGQNLAAAAPYLAKDEQAQYRHLSERMLRGLDESARKTSHQQAYARKQRRSE